ncbi:Endonuclease/exonuclease/phosphatase [Sporodiniella umbellata]|nr:Endonuclease/exonuclease/phosphatase [Sporodiniella umbellata]
MSKQPVNIEELKRLKQAKKEAKKAQNKAQPPSLSPPKVLERPFKELIHSDSESIRIMSFNILAQTLIKRELFPDSGDVLKWKTRRSMVIQEIGMYDADIMSLQEVDNFDTVYQEALSKLGYDTVYYHHASKKHGCVIAFKRNKFKQVQYKEVDYNTDPLCAPSTMTGNVAQVVALEYTSKPNIGFVVGNTHLYWRPSCNYERFRQTLIYVKHLLDFKSDLDGSIRWVPLVLGDDAVYGQMVDNKLTDIQLQDLRDSLTHTLEKKEDETNGEEKELPGDIDVDAIMSAEGLANLFHQTQKPWKSVYSLIGQIQKESGLFGEPKYTNYTVAFKGPLDYMFIEKEIQIRSLLMLPPEETVKPSLPNRNFGSDHLCLVADVYLDTIA